MAEAGDFTQLPELALLRIAKYLTPDSICKWSMTCRRLYRALPHFLVMRGDEFHIYGPNGDHWAPKPYFEGPVLTRQVRKLTLSVLWKDQGWGNRKGDIFISLMRGSEVIARKYRPFGKVAPHEEEYAEVELTDDSIVKLAEPSHNYKFTSDAGSGGGHQLIVKNFKVIAELYSDVDNIKKD